MTVYLAAAFACALVATVLALCREVRLRKALERLLQLVLSRWRAHAENPDRDRSHHNRPDERL